MFTFSDDDELQVVHEDLVEDRDFEEDEDEGLFTIFLELFYFLREINCLFTFLDYEDEDFMLETGEIRPNTWPRRNRQSRMKKSIGIARGVICLLILVGFGTI